MSELPVLLALDTSSSVGSVAIGGGKNVLARGWLRREGRQASELVPKIAAVLEEAGIGRENLDGVVVGRGPGSFTGLRIAAATGRGLAKALGISLWHRSSLAAAVASLAVELPISLSREEGEAPVGLLPGTETLPRYVLFDARSDRVYAACYRFLPDRMVTLIAPFATTVTRVLESWIPQDSLFCGEAAIRHASLITDVGHAVLPFPEGLPTAEGLLWVHHLTLDEDDVGPSSRWEPEYLRASSAAPPVAARDR